MTKKVSRIGIFFLLLNAVLSCSKTQDHSQTDNSYVIVWKYKVKPESKETFELEYGPNGTWVELFEKSKNYKGSFLYKSEEETSTYLLMDVWDSREAYETFKRSHRNLYDELSAQFESLYESEELMGKFNSL